MTFAYFTGTNRLEDVPIAETMLKSARAAGVQEDFILFSERPSEGFIHRPIAPGTPWRTHMAKLDLLRQLADTSYEYLVWLDTDNYFLRHPGDLSNLIRNNKCWVSMEGEITGPNVRQRDWWSIRFPQIVDVFKEFGCTGRMWNTNGGMWIVRREAITEFADKCEEVWNGLKPTHPTVSDEPPLAVAHMTLAPDYERDVSENFTSTWCCDWTGRFPGRLPEDVEWEYTEWLTGRKLIVRPAIVHAMRSKIAMGGPPPNPNRSVRRVPARAVVNRITEPVGSNLAAILKECGIFPKADCSCRAVQQEMDVLGISGCLANRSKFLKHLDDAANESSWLDWARVAAKGYVSSAGLLEESIHRTVRQAMKA